MSKNYVIDKYAKAFFDAIRIMRNDPDSNLAKQYNIFFDIHEIAVKYGNGSKEHEDYLEKINDKEWYDLTEEQRKSVQLFSAGLQWIEDIFPEEGDKSEIVG